MIPKIRVSNYFEAVLLLLTLAASSNMVCSSMPLHSNSTKVVLWRETPISSTSKLALDNLIEKLNSRFNIPFIVDVIPLNFSANKVYEILHSLKDFNKEEDMVVITTLSIKRSWFWSTLLSGRNSMIIDIRNPGPDGQTERDYIPTNFLSLIPPEAERKRLLQEILNHMMCRRNITLTCISSENDEENIGKKLQTAKDEMIFCIVLDCAHGLHSVFASAKRYGVLGSPFRWFSLYYFEQLDKFKDFPENLISIMLSRFNKSCQGDDVNIQFLNDALTLVAKVKKNNETGFEKYSIKRKFLETRFSGETGFIHFTKDQHLRNGSNYDILQLVQVSNTTGWLKIGVWQNNSFDTSLMAWIQNAVTCIKPPLLRISTKMSKPWVFFAPDHDVDENSQCIVGVKCLNYTNYTSETNNSYVEHCCTGMLVELLQELVRRIPFTPRLQFVKDKKFGSLNATTQQWNGMIGEVLRNEADTALYSLTITERRAKAVEFSYPIIAAGSGIIISVDVKKTYPTVNNAFLRPFKTDMWIGTISVVAVTVVTLWIAERLSQQRSFKTLPGNRITLLGNKDRLRIYTFIESMTYSWGVFVQKVVQEGGPRTLGGRVIVGVFGFYMIIVLSTYTANLAAIKVVKDTKTEISGIYDEKFLNPTSEFKFTSSKFTATSEFFKQSLDPRLNEVYRVMKDRLVSTRAEALKLLQSGEIQAFMEDTPALHYMASQQEHCNLKVVGKSFGNSGYGMPFRPNSSWEKPISGMLQEMHEDGFISKLSERWLEASCVAKQNVNIAERLGIRDESGILFVLAVFCAGSFLLLALEFLFKKIFSNFCYTHTRSLSYNVSALRAM